ncbi:hypothetical protein H2200_008951 [Cladophialophora chaetospira]|uniref:ADP-ribosylhydrolase ARH3 n=1 Tax=Cladophialophora chaetospira TaxID=386627 RepID=A0AA39CG64_9EURO|nr:hypothetical protein H2200_008951 [Cladophialophora chaetospira]
MSEPLTLASRIKGAIYSLAVFDALGSSFEFKPRGSFEQLTTGATMLPNDNFDLPPGCFTDDTSMALCLAHSLLDNDGRSNVVDQVKRYIDWWSNGYMSSTGEYFDIGVSTESALGIWQDLLLSGQKQDAPPIEETYHAILERITKEFSHEKFCGNGSLMRILPAALIASNKLDAIKLAQESSFPTHPHPRCVHACMIYASLVQEALQGASKKELAIRLSESINSPSDISDTSLDPVLTARIKKYHSLEDWQRTTAKSIRSTGYVVDTLEASLWAFFTTNTLEEAAIRAVNLGDDSDTVAAITGGLAGAFHGFNAIPANWLQSMHKEALLAEVAQKLIDHRNKTL